MTKVKRQIIKVDEEKCTGCALCIPGCPEGALQIVDTPNGPKARLVKEFYCDGLGACLGECPEGALSINEEEVEEYSEVKAMENIVKMGHKAIREHLDHLEEHNEIGYLKEAIQYLEENNIDIPAGEFKKVEKTETGCSCPGAAAQAWDNESEERDVQEQQRFGKRPSRLRNWPVQLTLINPQAPYLKDADLLISADCIPFAYADFQEDFVKEKIVIIGCPKLDDMDGYIEKMAQIFEINKPKSITVARMEVPCCGGLTNGVKEAVEKAGIDVPIEEKIVSIKGDKLTT